MCDTIPVDANINLTEMPVVQCRGRKANVITLNLSKSSMSRECSFELDKNKVSAGTVVQGNEFFVSCNVCLSVRLFVIA